MKTLASSAEHGAFFGELYLRTTTPFLSDAVTAAEARYLSTQLTSHGVHGPVLDVGCGHGRHARLLGGVTGIDCDGPSLAQARAAGCSVVQGDFFAMPFQRHAFAAAYAWYNSLFSFDEHRMPALFGEIGRCLRPGGLLIVQNSAWQRARAQPQASVALTLADGSVVHETSRYDAATGRDRIERSLTLPDGRVMAAAFFIRYYSVQMLSALLDHAGFTVKWVHGDVDGTSQTERSPELILGATRR